MPIYEYRCSRCGHELESMQKFSDPVLTQCPQCHEAALVKLVSAAGFHLKGGGWYATDFRGGGARPAGKSDGKGEGEGKSEGKGKGKGEGKGEGKGDGGESKSDGKSEGEAKSAAACGTGCGCH
jgi:putative FmdB family regulatory protein